MLGPANDVERNSLVRVATEAPHFEVKEPAFSASPNAGEGGAGPR